MSRLRMWNNYAADPAEDAVVKGASSLGNSAPPNRLRSLIALSIVLLCLVLLAGYLLVNTPLFTGRFWNYMPEIDCVSIQCRSGHPSALVHVKTGNITSRRSPNWPAPQQVGCQLTHYEILGDGSYACHGRAFIQDKLSGSSPNTQQAVGKSTTNLRSVDFTLPAFPMLIGQRYAVAILPTDTQRHELIAIDLYDPIQKIMRLELHSQFIQPGVYSLDDDSWQFIVYECASAAPGVGGRQEVFEIDSQHLRSVAAWIAPRNPHWFAGKLWTLDTQTGTIQYRQSDSWQTQHTVSVPAKMQRAIESCLQLKAPEEFYLGGGMLRLCTAPATRPNFEFYFLESWQKLTVECEPGEEVGSVHRSTTQSRTAIIASSNSMTGGFAIAGVDCETGNEVWRHRFRNQDTVSSISLYHHESIFASTNWGLTLVRIDRETGDIREVRPFAYLAIATPLLALSSIIWAAFWLRTTKHVLPGWVNGIGLPGIPLLLITAGLGYWGHFPGPPQHPWFNYCHGIFLGWAIACLAWAVLGTAHVGLRYVPTAVVLVIFLVVVNRIFAQHPEFRLEAVLGMVLPASATGLPLIAMRFAGYRWQTTRESAGSNVAPKSPLSIRDFFIAIASAAFIASCLAPLARDFAVPTIQVQVAPVFGVAVLMIMCPILWLALQQNSYLVPRLALATVAVIFWGLIIVSLLEFLSGGFSTTLLRISSYHQVVARVVATATCTFGLVCYCCRQSSLENAKHKHPLAPEGPS